MTRCLSPGRIVLRLGQKVANHPLEQRGQLIGAIGAWGAVIGASTAAGPIVGGLLVQHIGWEACFYVNVPVGVTALVMSLLVLKETPAAPASSFDIPGIAALSGSLFLLIFGLIKGPDYGWTSARTLVFLGAAALAGTLFVSVLACPR
jgi:MFS family permease